MDPLANNGKLFGIPIRIAAAADLIAMKKRAALTAEEHRVKHEANIELLKKMTHNSSIESGPPPTSAHFNG